jgi:hypothetical protein
MAQNLGMIGNLNEMVQDYFSTFDFNYLAENFDDYTDKASYIYNNLLKTKGPDLVKLSNLQNYLSDWERPFSYGGFLRSIGVAPVRPIDSPIFTNGSAPDPFLVRKPDLNVSLHQLAA